MQKKEDTLGPPAGLVNLGNTCFMGSVLQGLIATKRLEDLVMFRIPTESVSSIDLPAPRLSPVLVNGRGPRELRHEREEGMPIGDTFIATLEKAWAIRDAREKKDLSPRELIMTIGKKYRQYLDFRQQDAHEFLLHLLDLMRMEELDVIKKTRPPATPRQPNASPLLVATSETEDERLIPLVNMLFDGKLMSVLICDSCKHISHTFENFDDLSLPITHEGVGVRKRDKFKAAVKFFTSAYRGRDNTRLQARPQSQPPSPKSDAARLDTLHNILGSPKARSHESVFQPVDEDGVVIEDEFSDLVTPEEQDRSRKISDGLGGLGRRISIGKAFQNYRKDKDHRYRKEVKGGKEGRLQADRKPSKERSELRTHRDEKRKSAGWYDMLNIVESKFSEKRERISVSPMSSKSISPYPSPGKVAASLDPRISIRKRRNALKSVYLQRLLVAGGSVEHRTTHLTVSGQSGSSLQTLEDCLKRFTATENLDGIGCHNCWKIANKIIDPAVDTDASSEEESDVRNGSTKESPPSLRRMKSFSMPDLSKGSISMHKREAAESILHSAPPSVTNIDPPDSASLIPYSQSVGSSPVLQPRPLLSLPNGLEDVRITVSTPVVVNSEAASSSHNLAAPELPRSPIPTNSIKPADYRNLRSLSAPHVPHSGMNGSVVSPQNALHLQLPGSPPSHQTSRYNHDKDSSAESDNTDIETALNGSSEGDRARAHRRSVVPRSRQFISRGASKRYLIATAPPVLILHLRRFYNSSSTDVAKLKKNDDYVSFPEYLDLQPFLAPKKEDYGLGEGDLEGKLADEGTRDEDKNCWYRLYAVLVHIGSMMGGHYIAYVALPVTDNDAGYNLPNGKNFAAVHNRFNRRQWYHISDTRVRTTNIEEVLQAKAYMCMYERVT